MTKSQCLTLAAAAAAALLATGASSPPASVTKTNFGAMPDGRPVAIYTLKNAKGAEARIIDIRRHHGLAENAGQKRRFRRRRAGKQHPGGLCQEQQPRSFGALIGRYGNRIGKAQFVLDGKTNHLAPNNNGNTLHGGIKGFDKVVWTANPAESSAHEPQLVLTYTSKDGEEGYPGTLKVTAIYTLTDNNEVRIDFTATTDKDTVVNLTDHSYFNLSGKGDILGHIVTIPAANITPVDAGLIPLGNLQPVAGTPFDFRTPTAIGARINADDAQLKLGPGYDHNWVIDKTPGRTDHAGARQRSGQRPRPGSVVHRAGPAVLHGQFPGRDDQGQGRLGLSKTRRILHGTAALPGFPEQAAIPLHRIEAGADL